MFQLLPNANFDFMGKRQIWLGLSAVFVVVSIGLLLFVGLNLGVEFTGGTTVRLQFSERPDIDDIRSKLSAAGVSNPQVTTIGEDGENEIYVRLATVEGDAERDEKMTGTIFDALQTSSGSGPDLNVVDASTVASLLQGVPGLAADQVEAQTAAFIAHRNKFGIFKSFDDVAQAEGMTSEVRSHLETNSHLGNLALREQSFIGPAIGEELKGKAGRAILGSLIAMLVWIAIRFQWQWGLAAVITLAHDTIVVMGLFIISGKEMSLPVVAAFLTLVGYSINDTVVVFDRIRENMQKKKGMRFVEVINLSINQTLSRTIITSGLTFLAVLAILIFGGAALNPFAFVLTIGVVVGTYSSIYVASPILLLYRRFIENRKASTPQEAKGAPA